MTAQIDYWDCLGRTKQYANGGYYRDTTSEYIRTDTIEGKDEIELFEIFYKKNNNLRYCNGSYFKWTDSVWAEKYAEWLESDDYKKKSFNLFYGNGVVD